MIKSYLQSKYITSLSAGLELPMHNFSKLIEKTKFTLHVNNIKLYCVGELNF